MSKSLVTVRPDLTRLKEHFELKLQAVKQLADVVDSVKHGSPDLVLLDMRDREDYRRGHIKGAVSMPLEEIDKRHQDLPRDREVVTYCYNQYCHLSAKGALRLVEHGIPANWGIRCTVSPRAVANATTTANWKSRESSISSG